MECPVCLENIKIKGRRPSLTASCQQCDNNFHIECLFESATDKCPMCRCEWPVALTDPATEFVWSCEKCGKEFLTKYKCDYHEENCGKSLFQRIFK
ncbi:hypothetical protein [Yellowstone lake phycodnavirus 2]|uniref:hypothetical protein n=1 Tax=Yellowstone lake phycodnavirus 2 TaxID=1586714 RepID=UPI0006EBBB72|nr:hypothetical protein AR678_gp065 [Yellowstone lake phycodnavirus 2]BAT22339.1 hypothetical protein [Yellowstone lake phycodnavirus 2]